MVDKELEGVLPGVIQFLEALVARLTVLRQAGDEILRGLGVLLRYHSLVFDGCLTILLAFFLVSALAGDRAENGRR